MFDYEWATVQHTSTAGWRAPWWCPTRSRAQRLERYGARGKLRPYAGLKEEYYLSDFEPDATVLDELGLDRVPADRRRPHAARGLALSPLRERPVRGGARPRPRRAAGRAPAHRRPARAARVGRRLHRPAAGDRRAVADRPRRRGHLGGRHDEPRGGGAGHPRVDDVRGRPGAVDEALIAQGRLRRLTAPSNSTWESATAADALAANVRRDPALLVDLLLLSARTSRHRLPRRSGSVGSTLAQTWPMAAREAGAPTIRRMRRRIRSAAFPLHRHSLPQLAVDGALVALAYYLAFQLRFDGGPKACLSAPAQPHMARGWCTSTLVILALFARLPAPLALLRPARLRGAILRRARSYRPSATVVAVAVRSPRAAPGGSWGPPPSACPTG